MTNQQAAPALRFPGFTEDWQIRIIADIGNVVTGNTPDTTDRSLYGDEYDFVSPGDMNAGRYVISTRQKISRKGFERSRIIPVGSTLFVCIGSTIGKTAQIIRDSATNQQINAVIPKDNFDADFVYLALSRIAKKIASLAGEQAVPIISKGNFQKNKVYVPSLPEQRTIARYLTVVDTRIAAIDDTVGLLRQYKKSIMQKIFTQQIRFKDESGRYYPAWEEKKFGDVFERVIRKNTVKNKNVLTISGSLGLINQLEYYKHSYSSKNLSSYTLLNKNEFAYNKSYSNGYPMGAVKRLTKYGEGVVSPLYICFKNNEGSVNFFEQYFIAGLLNKEIEKIAQEGARNHGLLNVSTVEFFNEITLTLPSDTEQQKIADFLTTIDDKIKVEEAKLSAAKSFKKSLLQRMFV